MNKPYKLLIIDDSKEIVAGLQSFLKNKNYDVVTASDGLEGLKLFEAENQGFDLVITDLVMPYISGVGVISIIKKNYPDIPIIAITGWGEHPEALATEAQADLVLEKPFDLSKLQKLITELLAKKAQLSTD
ncbi:MAG: response regulator [Desulfobacterales bacterium]|nr:MAG: response regulator [Desulfobacterales bacterium]